MLTSEETIDIIEKAFRGLYSGFMPKELYEPINYMISIGGKRLRPKLCLLVYSLFSDKIDKCIINPAIALEIFHGFTLIHDDIMDNADLRRGQPTVYKKWNSNIAILSGDVMCIKSYELLSSCPSGKLGEIMNLFSKTATEVCEGQQLDMNFETEEHVSLQDYLKMIGLKTAVLIACAAKSGAIIADTDNNICNALYDYGYQLGLAFQIQDDLFDTFGNSNTFGKTIGGDIANNKKTWLLIECIDRLKEANKSEELAMLDKYMHERSISPKEKFDKVKSLYISSGAREAAESAIVHYFNNAIDIIRQLPFDKKQCGILEDFAYELLHRKK